MLWYRKDPQGELVLQAMQKERQEHCEPLIYNEEKIVCYTCCFYHIPTLSFYFQCGL